MKKYVLLLMGIAIESFTVAAIGAQKVDDDDLARLLDAIAQVESNGRPNAVGDSGRAVGTYQIHKLYWKDGTRLLGVKWNYDQAKDPVKARQVVRAYLSHYGRDKGLLDKARIHNGGPRGYRKKATLKYARKIERILQQSSSNS